MGDDPDKGVHNGRTRGISTGSRPTFSWPNHSRDQQHRARKCRGLELPGLTELLGQWPMLADLARHGRLLFGSSNKDPGAREKTLLFGVRRLSSVVTERGDKLHNGVTSFALERRSQERHRHSRVAARPNGGLPVAVWPCSSPARDGGSPWVHKPEMIGHFSSVRLGRILLQYCLPRLGAQLAFSTAGDPDRIRLSEIRKRGIA